MFYIPGTELTIGQAEDVSSTIAMPLTRAQGLAGSMARQALLGVTAVDWASSAMFAARGRKAASLGGAVSAAGIGVPTGLGIIAASQALIPIPVLGLAVGAVTAGALGFTVDKPIRRTAERAIQAFARIEQHSRGLHMGGGYTDTEQAYTMRARAAQEMGRSILNARSYLGMEAQLFHQ